MLCTKTCRKRLLYLFILLIHQVGFSAISQTKAAHPELKLYRRTLAPEQVAVYEKVLKDYHSRPLVEKTYSDNEELNRRYKEIANLPNTTTEELSLKTNEFYTLSQQATEKKCINLELESLLQAFLTAFWSESSNYSKAFQLAITLEEKLSTISQEEYPNQRASFFKLGEAYYLFNDFEKSIELLKKAITNSSPRDFTDCANLDARKIIGICYANTNRMDSSDYYFQSTLKSKDIVLDRPAYNAIALSNLGCNAMLKGEYEKALALDLEVLPFLKQGNDYGHLAGMYACQCFSYFGLKESHKIEMLADSILYYARKDKYNRNKRLKQAYTILVNYNAKKSNTDKAQEYNDSLINIYKKQEQLSSSQYIVHAKQEIAESKIAQRTAEVETQRQISLIVSLVFILSIVALAVIVVLYRRKQAAYRALVRKNIEWASSDMEKNEVRCSDIDSHVNTPTQENTHDSSDAAYLTILSRIYTTIIDKKLYISPDFRSIYSRCCD